LALVHHADIYQTGFVASGYGFGEVTRRECGSGSVDGVEAR